MRASRMGFSEPMDLNKRAAAKYVINAITIFLKVDVSQALSPSTRLFLA